MGQPNCYTTGLTQTASEYVFIIGMNIPMRYALQEFLDSIQDRQDGQPIYLGNDYHGQAMKTLVRSIKDQFNWIDGHCDPENETHLFPEDGRPHFASNIIAGWPYSILFVANETLREAFLSETQDDDVILEVLEHFENQCSMLDPIVRRRKNREMDLREEWASRRF